MSATLTALLPANFSPLGGVYAVTGTVGSYASRWSHRFAFTAVDISGLTGSTLWRLAIDDGALTYPSPPDSTGSTTPTATPVLDVTGLLQSSTYTPRARLENTPASPISVGTCTFTDASPLVVNITAHGLNAGDQIKFTTTGSLPGPLVVGTVYYVRATSLLANSITIATTELGSAVNWTSGAGSGTHTLTIFKAVTAWIAPLVTTFTTGAVLVAAPTFTTNPLFNVQVLPVDINSMLLGWNNYPTQTAADFLGTYIIARLFNPGAGGIPGSGTQISGLENSGQVPTFGAFADGAEVDVVLYPAIEYPLDVLSAFTASGGVTKAVAYPPEDLWVRGYGVVGTPTDLTPLAGPTTIQLTLGVPVAGTWNYLGSGQVESWALTDGPPGVGLLTPTQGLRLAQLDGIPTAEGVYFATLSCRAAVGRTRHVATLGLTIVVSGKLCLGWLASDPLAVDLQLMQRGRTVESWFFGADDRKVTRGETVRFVFVVRTGTATGANYGALVDPSAFKGLRFALLEEGNLDAEPWLEADAALSGSVVTVTSVGGHNVVSMPLLIASEKLDDAFDELDLAAGPEVTSISIPAVAQVSYLDAAGAEVVFRRFPLAIVQDADR